MINDHHPGMVIIASRGDLEMTIDASREGDRSIPGWLSFPFGDGFLGWRRSIPDGDRCISGWWSLIPGGYHCIPGWRSIHHGMASKDGDRCTRGWRLQHPWMAIVLS